MVWSAVLGAAVGRRRVFEVTGSASLEVVAARLGRGVAAGELHVAPSPVVPGPLLVLGARGAAAHRYGMSFEGRLESVDTGSCLRGDVGRSPMGRVHAAAFATVTVALLALGAVRAATDGSLAALVAGAVAAGVVAFTARADRRAVGRLEVVLGAAVAPAGAVSARPPT